MTRKTISRLLCTTALAAALCSIAGASTAVTAELNPNITVKIDGIARTFYNAQGKEVHPIVYQNTTYLPLRSMGELMNKNVNWNDATNTVTIEGARTSGNVTGVPDTTAVQTNVTFYLSPEITVVVDGKTRTFYAGDGKQVSPAVYNGSIYLPIRSVGNLMNKTVSWNESTQTITLSAAGNGVVTDYDSGNSVATPPQATTPKPGTAVTLEQAKKTALARVPGATEANLREFKREFDDGRSKYEGKIIFKRMEYEFTIDASTGAIVEWDAESVDD